MDIRFVDHPSFHRAALGMLGGSALFGLAAHLATPVVPLAALVGGTLGIAAGAAVGYRRPIWRLAPAVIAVVAMIAMAPTWATLGVAAVLLGLGLAINSPQRSALLRAPGEPGRAIGGQPGLRGALAAVAAAGVTLLAMWCAIRFASARELASWPAWGGSLIGAAAMGIVGVLAVLPRHLRIAVDPVSAALARLPAGLDPEVRDLCARSATIWARTKDRLADTDPGNHLVRDGVLKTIEVAARSADLTLEPGGAAELAARMTDLDQRIAAASDAEAKAQYQAARASLDDQQRYRDHILQGRERLIARMHNHVTALEKFQLAATGLDAARLSASGPTKQLEELSQHVAASSEALAEIELGERAPSVAVGSTTEPAAAAADA